MNERFEELISLADKYAVGKMADVGGSYFDFYNQKFAELVAKRCAMMCHDEALVQSEKGSLKALHKEEALDSMGLAIVKAFSVI